MKRELQVLVKLSPAERLLWRAVTNRRGFKNMSEMVRYVVRAYEETTRPKSEEVSGG